MRIQRDSARNILRRVFGIQGGTGPEELEAGIRTVCEVGRRGEFDLLLEQGIIAFHASRVRQAAAGQAPHAYVMASNQNIQSAYHVILERAEFVNAAGGIVRAFAGSSLGATNNAVVVPRDARVARVLATTDLQVLAQVQDGETAVIPPAAGVQVWQGRIVAGTMLRWEGPQLLRHVSVSFGTVDQLSFQLGTLAGLLEYTFYGYLVPLGGIS